MRHRRHRSSALLVALTLAAPSSAWAFGSARSEDASIEAVGSARLLGGYFHNVDLAAPLANPPDDGIGAAVFRLLLDGDLSGKLRYDANFFLELSRGPLTEGSNAFSTAGSFATPYRTRYLQWDFWDQGAIRGQTGVDRLAVNGSFESVDVTAGRFPVNYSVTSLFSPNDFFAPFSATAINRIYKPGVDALRLRLGLNNVSGLEVLGVLGSGVDGTPGRAHSAILVRLDTVARGFQGALFGGQVAQRWVLGGSIQGDLAGVTVRAEGHAGFPGRDGGGAREGPIHGRASAHLEYTFGWHNLTLGSEYAFFSDGASAPIHYLERADRFFPDDLPYLAEHYVGATLSLELIPILNASLVGLVNAQDESGLGVFSLAYNAANEVDFILGAMAGWGARPRAASDGTPLLQSEFGATPLAVFMESRVSF